MSNQASPGRKAQDPVAGYVLEEQIGYLLRLANQHHIDIFNEELKELTPTQFSLMARLYQVGEVSQNHLGRLVAMDAATTKGVIERLQARDLLKTTPSQTDKRRLLVSLTDSGLVFISDAIQTATHITQRTQANLTDREQLRLRELLNKMLNRQIC